ncbi:MAG: A/G-specific adenine glycosylase [Saprospiraceae bacterium]
MSKQKIAFTNKLLGWHKAIDRPMPWKDTRDPYAIWLSEIILQQTRVAQGAKYFENILAKFPTVKELAEAEEDEVLSAWKGLGYYSRARNLQAAAKTIVNDYNGVFPNTYSDILSLKGIGPYTASAIASFAFDLPHAVVDGNVYRVLSRYFGIEDPIDEPKGRDQLHILAQECLEKEHPGSYNQAIMDFGALQCKPQSPDCHICPMQDSCYAFQNEIVDVLPLKAKKIKIKSRHFNYFLISDGEKTLLRKRPRGDVWQGLYEPPLIETSLSISKKQLAHEASLFFGKDLTSSNLNRAASRKQKLTHQHISVTFFNLDITIEKAGYKWFLISDLPELAMPRIVDKYFEEINDGGIQGSLF